MAKIGRNDPCPCGSGKKYKRCHGNTASAEMGIGSGPQVPRLKWSLEPIINSPASVPPVLMKELLEHQEQEQERIRKFGHVRPEIAKKFKGHEFVAVGPKLYYGKNWHVFVDFLMDYLLLVLGRPWFDSEKVKTAEAQHPILQWRVKAINYMKSLQQSPNLLLLLCFGPF